jgi:hypothetical protein
LFKLFLLDGLGPVLAMPGDLVVFSSRDFTVNGVSQSRLPLMPKDGTLVVPKNCWFVWPRFAINVHGGVTQEAITKTMLDLSVVPVDHLAGKPLKRWFWRRQVLS